MNRDLERRLRELERRGLKLRLGAASALSPLQVLLGGAEDAVEPSTVGDQPYAVDDVVASLVAGNDMLALGVPNKGRPMARAEHGASQSIANNTATALIFNTEKYDTDGMHDTVTNNSRLTASTPGVYAISACARFFSNATGIRQLFLQINGNNTIVPAAELRAAVSGSVTDMTIAADFKFALNDYVEAVVLQTSGGALNVLSGAGITNLAMHYVGSG